MRVNCDPHDVCAAAALGRYSVTTESRLAGHKGTVSTAGWTPDGRWIVSGARDGSVQFWNPITGDAQMMVQTPEDSAMVTALGPTGLFATVGRSALRVWRYIPYTG